MLCLALVDNVDMTDSVHDIALFLAKEHPGKLSKLEIINFMRRYRYAEEVILDYVSEASAGRSMFDSAADFVQDSGSLENQQNHSG